MNHEKNEKEFFSGETVDGIVIYIEQWNDKDDKFDGMSMLLAENEAKILKNDFSEEQTAYFIKKINAMRDNIIEYVTEQEMECA